MKNTYIDRANQQKNNTTFLLCFN